jgi:uncharacterized membrane protein
MKKLLIIVMAGVLVTALSVNNPIAAQSAKAGMELGKAIPDGVMKIAEKSCIKCHAEPGNSMALAHVNLSKWDKYSPDKQAAKAKAMCKMVTKGKMPPKNFRKEHPDGVPTKEEIKTICDWAQSIAVPKK